jgi:exodeoxyribonuclease VII small subunit
LIGSLVPASQGLDIARMSFEANLKRLEQIVAQLEGDRLDLNAALRLFEEGIELLRLASGELAETESKVKELVERADGVLELRDLRT